MTSPRLGRVFRTSLQLGAAVALANNLKNNWATLFGAQGKAISQTDTSRAAKCDLYRTQHLLRNAQGSGEPAEAELTTGPWDAGTHFNLRRRVVGEPDFTNLAENLAADTGGNATYEDTIALGDYEYQAVPARTPWPVTPVKS